MENQIVLLESTKNHLLKQRVQLDNKIAEVMDKAKKREEVDRERMQRREQLGHGVGRTGDG